MRSQATKHSGASVRSQNSAPFLAGPVLQKQQKHYKTTQTSCPNWAATFGFSVGESFYISTASRPFSIRSLIFF